MICPTRGTFTEYGTWYNNGKTALFRSPYYFEVHVYRSSTLCALFSSRKARERELAKFDENRRAVGMLNPLRIMNCEGMFIQGAREDICEQGTACPDGWKVKVMDKKLILKKIRMKTHACARVA